MKKIYIAFVSILLMTQSCKKSSLDLTNPNEPVPEVLTSEEGMKRAALGVYTHGVYNPGTSDAFFGYNYWWFALANHDIMGDSYTISAGNFSWRWVNQVSKITLGNGTVLNPPQGGGQAAELRARNDRSYGDDNAFYHEWLAMYLMNNQANLVLNGVENPLLKLSGSDADVAAKKATFRAWGYWWKGFIYSRIGSMYVSGIIANDFDPVTYTTKMNSTYVSHDAIIQEANRNFDLAVAQLNAVPASSLAAYEGLLGFMIPTFTQTGKGGVLTIDAWKNQISTYKARNLLANKKVSAMTPADWTQVLTLSTNGIKEADKIFTMRSADVNDLVSITAWAPYRLQIGWANLSERLVQDFKPGDERYTRNIRGPVASYGNERNRGAQYATRWRLFEIANGGDWASTGTGDAEIPVGCSYEENELMIAEANIYLNNIEEGLGHIDNVRDYQNAGLPAVKGTGLNKAQALEELRRERRIGLFLKNVAFYDARRWNVTAPAGEGGGRSNAWVVVSGVVDPNAKIEYNYLDYWDVPKNELDFNVPGTGSSPTVSPR
jgi:hypothetical protein